MRRTLIAIALTLVACKGETPAPQPAQPPKAGQPQITGVTTAAEPLQSGGTYEGAMNWFRSTHGFDFAIEEAGVRATGTMARETVGAETVAFNVNGETWRATAGPRGVTWERNDGGAWKAAAAPEWGPRLYQRVTVAFDPRKKEPAPQLAASDATTNSWRFTNANSGEVHEVQVNKVNGQVSRIAIADAMKLTISNGRD